MYILAKFVPNATKFEDLRVYVLSNKGLKEELRMRQEFSDKEFEVEYQVFLRTLAGAEFQTAQGDEVDMLMEMPAVVVNFHARTLENKFYVRVIPLAMVEWHYLPEFFTNGRELTAAELAIYKQVADELVTLRAKGKGE